MSHNGKVFANVNICSFLHVALWFNQQGRNKGARGRNYPGAESLWEHWNIAGAPKNPNNATRTFFNAVHLLPEDLRFEHGGTKLASFPGRHLTSLSPVNLEISSAKKPIHSLLCCKTMMQTKCGHTNCTGNSPETAFSFSFSRLVKSYVSTKFSTLRSSFYCCLSFSFQGHQALKKKLVKKQTIFIQHSRKSRTANATAYERASCSHAAKKKRNGGTITKQYHRSRYPIRGWAKCGTQNLTFNWQPDVQRKILFILEYFKICSTFMGTKKGRIYNKGAPFKEAPQRFRWGAVAPSCPPWITHWFQHAASYFCSYELLCRSVEYILLQNLRLERW